MTEWFREWFDEEYLALYPHRDEAEAARLVGFLAGRLPWRAGVRVLDVGCGAGRHGRAFEARGAWYVGVDLSAPLLRRARHAVRGGLVRADMRALPVRPASMDVVASLFTSFGYFGSDAEHEAAFRHLAAAVRPGGTLVLDYLNAVQVRDLVLEAQEEWGRARALSATRRLSDDQRHVVKRIPLPGGRLVEERVRLFSLEELQGFFARAGLAVAAAFGDYDGGPLDRRAPRVLVLGERR